MTEKTAGPDRKQQRLEHQPASYTSVDAGAYTSSSTLCSASTRKSSSWGRNSRSSRASVPRAFGDTSRNQSDSASRPKPQVESGVTTVSGARRPADRRTERGDQRSRYGDGELRATPFRETSGRLTTVAGRRADIGRVLPRVKIGRARPVALDVGRGAIGRLRGSGGRVLLIGGRDGLEFVEQS